MGCTTDAHPLYGIFMSRLSSCIFTIDESDINNLQAAKFAKLEQQGMEPQHITAQVINNAVTYEEILRHCRRKTRGSRDNFTN